MKLFLFSVFLISSCFAQAECVSTPGLKGVHHIENCSLAAGADCVAGERAVYDYMKARKDDDPAVLFIGLHGSLWHLYGPDFHILEIAELAELVKQQGGQIKRVVLLSSWSGKAAAPREKSLAEKLSAALDGMPVSGQNGFIWYAANGDVETTRQAFTVVESGPYRVARGDKVMASLAAGWVVFGERTFVREKNAEGLLRAGVGADIYLLCPERALSLYEAGAALSNPIAAYNAAIMLLDRGKKGDAEAAVVLLKKSAALGDAKAVAKLRSLPVKPAR